MDKGKSNHSNEDQEEYLDVVIPKENAVFWLDKNGNWNNEGGKFRLKKIIRLFNSSIKKDELGYHVCQINGNRREKTYFTYEDTVLFAIDIKKNETDISLLLNTGERIKLIPGNLFIKDDNLYMQLKDEGIKFSDRSMIKLSTMMEFNDDKYYFRTEGQLFPIVEKS